MSKYWVIADDGWLAKKKNVGKWSNREILAVGQETGSRGSKLGCPDLTGFYLFLLSFFNFSMSFYNILQESKKCLNTFSKCKHKPSALHKFTHRVVCDVLQGYTF